MKKALDKMEIARFHKMLAGDEENDISPMGLKACSKALDCEIDTLRNLTPKAHEEFAKNQAILEKAHAEGVESDKDEALKEKDEEIAALKAQIAAK